MSVEGGRFVGKPTGKEEPGRIESLLLDRSGNFDWGDPNGR